MGRSTTAPLLSGTAAASSLHVHPLRAVASTGMGREERKMNGERREKNEWLEMRIIKVDCRGKKMESVVW